MPTFLSIFHAQTGPSTGANNDGVLIGAVTPAPAPICLNGFHSLAAQHVALNDVVSGTTTTVIDESSISSAYIAGTSTTTWAFGDNTPTDQICVDLTPCLAVGATGMALQVVTAGATTGSITPTVQWWNGTAYVTASNVTIVGSFNQVGTIQINFTAIPTTGVNAPMNLPLGGAGIRPWLFVSFPSLTFTSAAGIGGLWSICAPSAQGYQNLTSVMNQTGASPSFTGQPGIIFPQVGDLFLYGSPNKFCKINERLFRSAASTYSKQWVYWNGTAWSTFPANTLVDGGQTNQVAVTGTETDFTVAFLPPSDWASQTLTDSNGGLNTGFYVGLQVTGVNQPFVPPPPAQLVFSVTEIMGSNVTGAPLTNGGSFNEIVMVAGQASTARSLFAVSNTRTGQVLPINIPANTAQYAAPISFTAAAGDTFVSVQVAGAATPANNLQNVTFIAEGP